MLAVLSYAFWLAKPSTRRFAGGYVLTSLNLDASLIREKHANALNLRDRDFADQLGIREAQLVAAYCGQGATRIQAHPDQIMPACTTLGEVMALTRNPSCVHEKVGAFDNYHPGTHAAMILTEAIDLRLFPSHWCHAFLVEKETENGLRRSIQVFDAAGDAIHKIFLRDASNIKAWTDLKKRLALDDQSANLRVAERKPTEAAKSAPEKLDILRKEWTRLTDTHQFLRLTSKLKMNRLGAYRIAGAPFAQALAPTLLDRLLTSVRDSGIEIMIFVGNRGCIQIHTGPIKSLKPMGPWQNILDPGFNLHLRADHVAEMWAVHKPTQRGMATSVEAFDTDGSLIFQIFGVGKDDKDSRPAWNALVDELKEAEQ